MIVFLGSAIRAVKNLNRRGGNNGTGFVWLIILGAFAFHFYQTSIEQAPIKEKKARLEHLKKTDYAEYRRQLDINAIETKARMDKWRAEEARKSDLRIAKWKAEEARKEAQRLKYEASVKAWQQNNK